VTLPGGDPMGGDRGGRRAWQRMLSGRRLDLLDPSPFDVEIEDIAHGLARVARWNGQTIGDHAYSVAQHSLLVDAIQFAQHPESFWRTRLATLLHDAPEYVIGDMISPFKAVLDGAYKAVEARLATAIFVRFGLPPDLTPKMRRRIKRADQVAAYLEATTLAGFGAEEATRFFGRPAMIEAESFAEFLTPWTATDAESRYLAALKAASAAVPPYLQWP
jgi:5'-deoxynucleotidase YfbR-like HD superfamily hydrolase